MKKVLSVLLVCMVLVTSSIGVFAADSLVDLYRYRYGTEHFYTTSFAELGYGKSGYDMEGIQGYVYPSPVTGSIPLYRYNNGKDHFYTTNFNELGGGKSGYKFERIECYVIP